MSEQSPDDLFDALDRMFGPESETRHEPASDEVTVFVGPEANSALYLNGSLHLAGAREDVVAEALVLLGASVYTSSEHLLGQADGPPATDLAAVLNYSDFLGRVEELRAEAAELRAEADYLEDELGG